MCFLGLQNLSNAELVNFQDEAHLLEHFTKHASEWGNKYLNPEQYLKSANDLLNRVGSGISQFTSSQGWLFKYDANLNEFLLVSPVGTISTYFRPVEGFEYWLKQVEIYGG